MATTSGQFHEDLRRRAVTRGPSDRNFGLMFASVFLVIGLWPLWKGQPVRVWALALGGVFFMVSIGFPLLLHDLNRLWTRVGLFLGRITNPIITASLFFLVFVPAGFVLRLLLRDKDPLRLCYDQEGSSYWVQRKPPGPASETMLDQF